MPSVNLSCPNVQSKIKTMARRLRILRKKLFQNGYNSTQVETIILQKIFKSHEIPQCQQLPLPQFSTLNSPLTSAIYLHIVQMSKNQKDYVRLLNQMIRLIENQSSKLQINVLETSSDEEEKVIEQRKQDKIFKKEFHELQLIKAISTLKQKLNHRYEQANDTLKFLKQSLRF